MLLSNSIGLERIKHCHYVVSNIYNMKHYYKTEKGFKRIEVKSPLNGELMLTQLSNSQHMQSYPVLKHSYANISLRQRSIFHSLSIDKDGDDFYIKVMDTNWYVKYEGEFKEAVNQDYLFHQKHKELVEKALRMFDEKVQLVKQAKERVKRPQTLKQVGKRKLKEIANKYNKQHVSRKRR